MGKAPDEIAADIEQTRAELADDVDRLADKTSPRRAARRGGERIKGVARSARERVMGSNSDTDSDVQERAREAGQTAREKAGGAAEAVKSTPEKVSRRTESNPMAAGLIAFGAGLLAASLLPTSQAERQSAQRVSERVGDAEPVKEALSESAERIKDEVSDATKSATQEVRQTAVDAAQTTRDEGRDRAESMAERARGSSPTGSEGDRDTGSSEAR